MTLHIAPLINIVQNAGKSRESNGESLKIFVNYVINIVQNGRKSHEANATVGVLRDLINCRDGLYDIHYLYYDGITERDRRTSV